MDDVHGVTLVLTVLLVPYISFTNLLNDDDSAAPIDGRCGRRLVKSPICVRVFGRRHALSLCIGVNRRCRLLSDCGVYGCSNNLKPGRHRNSFGDPRKFCDIRHGRLGPSDHCCGTVGVNFPGTCSHTRNCRKGCLVVRNSYISVNYCTVAGRNVSRVFRFIANTLIFNRPDIRIDVCPFHVASTGVGHRGCSGFGSF